MTDGLRDLISLPEGMVTSRTESSFICSVYKYIYLQSVYKQ